MAKKTTLETLSGEIKDLSESVGHIVTHMATKDDLKRFATKDDVRAIVAEVVEDKLEPIRDELVSIRRDLDDLKRRADNAAGLTKEIDHALERIAAIEKHLGINKKIAA